MPDLLIPALVFVGGVADVALGTIRMLMVTSGLRWQAAIMAMAQIAVFVLAIGAVVTNLDNPFAILGYTLGWGAGTFLGMWAEERVALGFRLIQVINGDNAISVAAELRARGLRVTRIDGHGMRGSVEVAITVIPRRSLDSVRAQIMEIAPRAFITVERAERPTGGSFTEEIRSRRMPWIRDRAGSL
ncbi:MAG: DUF5698 domain-containing protein [Dehalococcoidia bacterium]|nr:DUF5698 domain-containing protein [Dehalococcoidia bacterium]